MNLVRLQDLKEGATFRTSLTNREGVLLYMGHHGPVVAFVDSKPGEQQCLSPRILVKA